LILRWTVSANVPGTGRPGADNTKPEPAPATTPDEPLMTDYHERPLPYKETESAKLQQSLAYSTGDQDRHYLLSSAR
jgi:hypothetical protein